jgi:hypothetical protein
VASATDRKSWPGWMPARTAVFDTFGGGAEREHKGWPPLPNHGQLGLMTA